MPSPMIATLVAVAVIGIAGLLYAKKHARP